MAAARIGTPSPILNPCGSIVTTHKPTARFFFCDACKSELLAQKRVRFLVGNKKLAIARNPKPLRGNASPVPMASASGGSGSECRLDEDNNTGENGEDESGTTGVQLGRRMLLGAVFTAVALSSFEKPGVALTGDKGSNKGKGGNSAAAGGEKGKENAGPPQIGDKWKLSRVYDATVLGEPVAVGGERSRVWQKLLQARVVYLGEAERVPVSDDRVPHHKP